MDKLLAMNMLGFFFRAYAVFGRLVADQHGDIDKSAVAHKLQKVLNPLARGPVGVH